MTQFNAIALVTLAMTMVATTALGDEDQIDLALLSERYCISQDGDHVMTWSLAAHDGFAAIPPDRHRQLRLPGARNLRGFSKFINGREVQVLTANNILEGMGNGSTAFNLCWVSVNPGIETVAVRSFQEMYGTSGIRQEGARLFIWAPREDGTFEVFGRSAWQRRGHALPREENARLVIVGGHREMVTVTFMAAASACEACSEHSNPDRP